MTTGLLDVENDILADCAFDGESRRRLVIVEERVFELFGAQLCKYFDSRRLPAKIICVPADETVKNVELSLRLAAAIDEFGLDRRHEPIIAMGGGVLLDIVGWVASQYRRGTPYVRIPTTLIGLVDAGIGVKTGVNYNGHKNLLGSYHAPAIALLDPAFLATLPDRHISNGLAEIAKMGLVRDGRLWDMLVEHGESLVSTKLGTRHGGLAGVGDEVLSRAVHSMLAELQPNLWETELDRLVDFGHTFSPKLEMAALPQLLHGEAVAIDMALSSVLSHGRGLLDDRTLQQILTTLSRLGLPLTHPACEPQLLEEALRDTTRHRAGRQRLPIPDGVGQARFVDDVTPAELRRVWRALTEPDTMIHASR